MAVRNLLGEGPAWLEDERRLAWVDISRHLVLRLDPVTGEVTEQDLGKAVGAVAPAAAGGLVAALQGEFAQVLPTGEVRTIAPVEPDRPGNRMNDGKCDSRGRFWAGSMAYDLAPGAAALYRLDPGGVVTTMLQPVTISNGIAWSPEDRLMYYVDSPTQRVDVFDYEPGDGRLSRRRGLLWVPPAEGMPDGLCIDAEGCLWVAYWGGSAVRRITPAGKIDLVIELPASRITSCAFGGGDYGDLYITSASTDLSPDQLDAEPHAGSLFCCRPGPRGLPANRFAVDGGLDVARTASWPRSASS